jgi:hypothetical protein
MCVTHFVDVLVTTSSGRKASDNSHSGKAKRGFSSYIVGKNEKKSMKISEMKGEKGVGPRG